jgi:hypothetical protein
MSLCRRPQFTMKKIDVGFGKYAEGFPPGRSAPVLGRSVARIEMKASQRKD